jgi:hypothetical protein
MAGTSPAMTMEGIRTARDPHPAPAFCDRTMVLTSE